MWCSWVIASPERKVFFSGDSGYGPHFKQIGDKYGPFDLALMECGQYDPRWSDIHMLPEQTVQAHADVRGGVLLPIHWGAFTLSLHDWNDPVRRATAEAERRNVPVATPKIGEPVDIGDPAYPKEAWWA
ncbi:Beta-lactamase superfamily domain protein [compost metagenome]